MSTKPHYFRIGVFVIAAMALILGAVVVFGAGLLTQEKIYFETYFEESVSGLIVGSPVELKGVRIGQVEKITFARDEYGLGGESSDVSKYEDYVVVLCSIPGKNLPAVSQEERIMRLHRMISRGLRVQLTSNILTGQAYLQADYLDPKMYSLPPIGWKPKHLYAPSASSTFATLKDSVDKVLFRLQEIDIEKLVATAERIFASLDKAVAGIDAGGISEAAKALLTEALVKVEKLDTEKISAVALESLSSVNNVVTDANIAALSGQAQGLFAELRETNQNLKKLLAGSQPDSGHNNLPEVIARLNRTLGRIDKLIATQQPQIDMILANFSEISESVKVLTETLKQHPSELLLSKPPSKSEALK